MKTQDKPQLPLVIYDFRVLAHMVYNARESLVKKEQFKLAAASINYKSEPLPSCFSTLEYMERMEAYEFPDLTSKWLKLSEKLFEFYPKIAWAIIMNRGPNAVDYQPHTAIVVDDNGADEPYWRKQLFEPYKANRKPKADQFYSVAQQGLSYITDPKSPFLYLTKPAYEADDLAGAMVKIKRLCQSYQSQQLTQKTIDLLDGNSANIINQLAARDIWLYTVDSDWLQLVDRGVTWYNTGPWEPRVRGKIEAINWAKKRLKVTITSPEQIVDTKMKQGDKSDNLPPGSPRYLIDLMNIHKDWELSKRHPQFYSQLWTAMAHPVANQRLDHYKKARTWFLSHQLPMPV